MADSKVPEVLIRSRLAVGSSEFLVVDGASHQLIGGPFSVLSEAISFAVAQRPAQGARILYEALDQRGRSTGAPMLLRIEPA